MSASDQLQAIFASTARHLAEARPLGWMYLHLLVSALFPIYTAAHASLSRPLSAAAPKKRKRQERDEDEEDEEVVQKMEGLSPQDAIIFPVTAGIVLTGLYFLIKRYGADLINLILGWYFAAVGVYSVARLSNDGATLVLSFLFPTYFAHKGRLWKISTAERKAAVQGGADAAVMAHPSPLPGPNFLPSSVTDTFWSLRAATRQRYNTKLYVGGVFDLEAKLTVLNVLCASVGVVSVAYANLVDKPWWLTNLQGFAVCYGGLQLMSPTTFTTGSLILSGLFFYDIWAVFFTPLMVTVAKNLDQPIKLVFPRPDEPGKLPGEPPIKSFSMLGLGDIVLPGLMIGLALRFDLYMFYLRKQTKRFAKQSKSADSSGKREETVEKAQYTPVTGHWGDRFWTRTLAASVRPAQLQTSFPKPYFTASMAGYVIGMITTLAVMTVFQHAQPALLYLVPGVLISLWGTALVRGEAAEMWKFSEAVAEEPAADTKTDATPKKTKSELEQESESWAQYMWHQIFGSEAKDADAGAGAQSDAAKETDKSKTDSAKKGDTDTIISFSVTRYNPTTAGDPGREATTDSTRGPPQRGNTTTSSLEDGSEDSAVLVSSAHDEHARELSLRSRTMRVRNGTEKESSETD